MRRTKEQKGITLIALIITIVVLLILAVVAVGTIQNDGIISHAGNVANTYNQAVKNEQQHLDNYLSYLDNVNGGTKTYKAYTVGQEVKVMKDGVEHAFYVIENSSETEEKVLLLAKECISQTTFSSTNYWSTIEGITYPYDLTETGVPDSTHYAAKKAYDYGKQFEGVPGRLMTYTEANTLKDNTNFSTKLYETCFWLGYANSATSVGCVFSAISGSETVTSYDFDGIGPGIRGSSSS